MKSVSEMMHERQLDLAKLLSLVESWEKSGPDSIYTRCAHQLRAEIGLPPKGEDSDGLGERD